MSNKKQIRVCHMSSAHGQEDIRIFHKECVSLAKFGYEVFFIARGKAYDKNGVHIIGVSREKVSRKERMLKVTQEVYSRALEIDADIYHAHDPELLPICLKLKKRGKTVVFDSHEDVSAQILDKEWIPVFLRRLISKFYKIYESYAVKKFDAVIAATPHIAEQFEGRTAKVEVINNYPKLDDIVFHDTPFEQRESIICYAGGINELRGESVMVEAVNGMEATLILAGEHEKMDTGKVVYLGEIERKEVNALYGRSRAGIVCYQPLANHMEAQPIKLFEYMAAGLPVIASNFPLWKKIIEENGCGICVDPTSAQEIREACKKLVNNPQLGQEMGRNGRKAVMEKYNWGKEEGKLVKLYAKI